MTNTLPKGWEEKTLGDMCDIFDSKRRPITQKDRIKGEYPYYGATGIVDYVDGYLFDEPLLLIGEDGAKWGKGEECAFIARGKYWVNNHAHILKPKDNLSMQYLVYWLNYSDLNPYITGTTVPKLNQQKLKSIKMSFPSLPEQKRIVEKLDKIFADIDKAKENTQKNLTNAKEIFYSSLNNIFTGKMNGWKEKTLGEVCEVIAGQSPSSIYYNDCGEGLPFYQGKKEFSDKYINSATVWTSETTKIALANDILMSVRAPVGPVNYATEKCCIGRGLAAIRPKKEVETDFVFYFLQSIEKKIAGHDGTVFNSISRKEIEKINIPVPPLPEQKKIVAQLDALRDKAQELEQIYTKKLADLDELKQSVLQQAFSGKL